MTERQKRYFVWYLPAFLIGLYCLFILTNGNLAAILAHDIWGGKLYPNIWDHLLHGNLYIDPVHIGGEEFIVGPNKFVTYFGIMPVILRGFISLWATNFYDYCLCNLSMIIATLLALGSVWYAVRQLASGSRLPLVIGASLVVGLLIASPISYLLTWGWVYHEAILWGLAWTLMFVSVIALWVFDPKRINGWHGLLLGLAVGMAMMCRPTIALMPALVFAFLCLRAILLLIRNHDGSQLRVLWPGIAICSVLAVGVILTNYMRWGNPFTFVRISQNVQFIEYYPERGKAIEANGEFNISRLPHSLYYYLMPSPGNFQRQPPFVSIDRELKAMDNAPHYDYIEGSRVPIVMSMTYLLVIGILGLYSLRKFRPVEIIACLWLLIGGCLTYISLLTVYAASVRYSAEFMPPVAFMGLVYIVAIKRGLVRPPSRKMLVALALMFVLSTYMTFATMLSYKQFVWDVPSDIRSKIQRVIRYNPTDNDTKHIINGKRYPVY